MLFRSPIRAIAEGLGAEVEWKEATREVEFTKGTDTVILTIGSNIVSINGRNTTIDVPADIKDDRTFVPLRFVSEALGASVEWVSASRTVLITTKAVSEAFIEPKFITGTTSSTTSLEITNHMDYFKAGGYTIQAENLTYPELNVVKMDSAGVVIYRTYNDLILSSQLNSPMASEIIQGVHNGTSRNLLGTRIRVVDGTKVKFRVTVSNEKETRTYYPVITMGLREVL